MFSCKHKFSKETLDKFREKARNAGAAVKELCETLLPEGHLDDATEEEIRKYGKLLENMHRKLIHFIGGKRGDTFSTIQRNWKMILFVPLSIQFSLVNIRRVKALTSVRSCLKPFLLRMIAYKSHWLTPICLIVRECKESSPTTAHSWIGVRSKTAPQHSSQAGHCDWNNMYSSR